MTTFSSVSLALFAAALLFNAPGAAALDATAHSARINAAAAAKLPLQDLQDFEDARRGFIATIPDGIIRDDQGKTLNDLNSYAFLLGEAPATVNPALWRIARLNTAHGLFEVRPRIYQIRGFDIANMTIVEGESGLIIIDPLTTREGAAAGLALYRQQRGGRPVVAVIYTHSHVDHFGGVRGVLGEAQGVRVIAPKGFLDEAVSENLLAGNAMIRRSLFQFGGTLAKSPSTAIDAGLGKPGFAGTIGLVAPTEVIASALQTLTVDGVEIVCQLTPGSEAPAEMNLYFPQFRALDLAENATHTLHNLLPLRGAQVRDANAWAKYLDQTLDLFGSRSDVIFAQHHWPTWGQERGAHFLAVQRDLYKYLHDQTLRLLNRGYTAAEIAERLRLPDSLEQEWSAHGLYGSLKHNVKAIYQRYLGWYDANPAHLDPLPGVAAARKTLAYMGGSAAVMERARQDYERGEYRWVAQVLDVVIQAEPGNQGARELEARAFEQLAFVAESATWRNAYLQGASELRTGPPAAIKPLFHPDFARALSLENLFDTLAIRIDGLRLGDRQTRINWRFTDTGERYLMRLEHGALTYLAGREAKDADLSVTLDRESLARILSRQTSFRSAIASGRVRLDGDAARLADVFGQLDEFPTDFPILTPRDEP